MLKMRPMISPDRAYNDALQILTPSQRSAVSKRFDDAAYVPVVPSLADEVPSSLDGLKPHEIPQVFVAERQKLGLSDDQATNLQNLHVAIRDEPHRYVQAQHGAKGHPHMMMEPMISKRRAYNDAMSYLTADQQAAANQLFRARDYKPKLAPAAKKEPVRRRSEPHSGWGSLPSLLTRAQPSIPQSPRTSKTTQWVDAKNPDAAEVTTGQEPQGGRPDRTAGVRLPWTPLSVAGIRFNAPQGPGIRVLSAPLEGVV